MRPLLLALLSTTLIAQDEFVPLFNGKDLTGWEGDPILWSVTDGTITGNNPAPDAMPHNSFLIWRAGTVKDFELRATIRITGDNNTGIQYRSRPLPEVGPFAITGYQCDIHPAIEHTGMTYDPKAERWLVAEHTPVKVDVSQWQEYTIIARGNHLTHKINGQITSELTDFDEKGRALEGLLAIQLHRGNPNTVHIKDIRLKVITNAELIPFTETQLPPTAKKIPKPTTRNPQGTGPSTPAK
jgi:hypothetical protein